MLPSARCRASTPRKHRSRQYEFTLFRPWQISDSIVGSTFCLSAEPASAAMSSNTKYEIPQFYDVVDAILM